MASSSNMDIDKPPKSSRPARSSPHEDENPNKRARLHGSNLEDDRDYQRNTSAQPPKSSRPAPSSPHEDENPSKRARRRGSNLEDNRDYQPNFRPQPADIIIRDINTMGNNLLRDMSKSLAVMGIIKIYDDESFFLYAEGQAHRVKFTFREGDLILRFGDFTSRLYTWRFRDIAELFYHHRQKWFKVAHRDNSVLFPDLTDPESGHIKGLNPDQMVGWDTRTPFRLSKGDFLIHRVAAAGAPDRPWGSSFELRVMERSLDPEEDPACQQLPALWATGDICVRVRMGRPPNADRFEATKFHEMWDPGLWDVFEGHLGGPAIPMLVFGFVCVGDALVSKKGPFTNNFFRSYPSGIWRYLGFDKHVFTDLIYVNLWNPERFRSPGIPTRPGDLLINLTDVINHNPGIARQGFARLGFTGGHILIARDGLSARADRPETRPETMIVRTGMFETMHDDMAALGVYDRAPLMVNRMGRDDYATWATLRSPKLLVHNPLADQGWVQPATELQTILPPEPQIQRGELPNPPLMSNVGVFGMDHTDSALNYRTLFEPHFTTGDLILNKAPRPDYDTRALDVVPNDRPHMPGFQTLVVPESLQSPTNTTENAFNLFYWFPGYRFLPGDHLIRYNVEQIPMEPDRWFCTAELLVYNVTPPGSGPTRNPTWIYRGGDHVILPNRNFHPNQPRHLDDHWN